MSTVYFQMLQIENCFICRKEIKYNSKIKEHATLGVASQSHIWMVCCATLLCSSASKNFWVLGALHLHEKRCRTLLRGGELSYTVDNQYMKKA